MYYVIKEIVMVSKVLALTFVLLTTTSGWAATFGSGENQSKYCPYAKAWIPLNANTASIQKSKSASGVGQTVNESATVSQDQANH